MENSTTCSILEPNGLLQAPQCIHCGETLTTSSTVESGGRYFCCTGCSSVYELLHKLGLDDFYKIRDSQSTAKIETPFDTDSGESYDYLNTQSFKELYTRTEDPLTMNFYIEGIHCAACLWLIEKIPEFSPGILSVSLNMSDNTAAVRFKEPGRFSSFPETIRKIGYKAHPIKIDGDESIRELKRKESRTALIRISVAAVCAGNIMLLSAAIYAGAGGAFRDYFGLLNLLLTLPVVTYCAYPFYKSVWSSLKVKRATVDIPVVFVILAGFLLSSYSYYKGTGEVYFDSITAFVFLLLASRYFLRMVQDKAAGTEPLSRSLFSSNRVLIRDDKTREYSLMPIERLEPGQVIRLLKGERIPVDGELLCESSELSLSVLTGENIPVTVLKHDLVFAGSVLESEEAVMRVEKTGNYTRIGEILDTVNRSYQSKFNFTTQSDRYATVFTLIVGVLSIVSFFVISSIFTPGEALRRVIAFVLIACPCAFVFALPLSLGLSIKSGIKKGYLVKDTSIFDKLPNIKNVFFDKTGTLTKGVFKILKWDTHLLSAQDKAAVLAIERESGHPVARAVVSFLSDLDLPTYTANNFRVIPSKGVEGRVKGNTYTISSESIDQHSDINAIISTKIVIYRDGEPISDIFLGDSLKEDAKYVVGELQERDKKVFILSGDKESSVRLTGKRLGIPEDRVFWEKTPEEKAGIISRNSDGRSIMIGDGFNDAAALSSADVGIAIQGSVEESMKISDAYILNNDLFSVLELINQGSSVKDILHRNTVFSILYNVAAGSLALLGYISPLIAAVLMPLSSLLLIGSTMYGQQNPRFKELKARL
jgi:heavy metal translocating P-type ATPase